MWQGTIIKNITACFWKFNVGSAQKLIGLQHCKQYRFRFKTASFLCFFHSSKTFETHPHFRRLASEAQLLSNFSHSEAVIGVLNIALFKKKKMETPHLIEVDKELKH